MSELDLSQVNEGLVVRPGDHLILSFPAGLSDRDAHELKRRAKLELGPDIKVTVIAGADQIVKIEPDAG